MPILPEDRIAKLPPALAERERMLARMKADAIDEEMYRLTREGARRRQAADDAQRRSRAVPFIEPTSEGAARMEELLREDAEYRKTRAQERKP